MRVLTATAKGARPDRLEQWNRAKCRAFLKLTEPSTLAFWRSLPNRWVSAGELCRGSKLSTGSMRLARLYNAGAVEKERRGKEVHYRPVRFVEMIVAVMR